MFEDHREFKIKYLIGEKGTSEEVCVEEHVLVDVNTISLIISKEPPVFMSMVCNDGEILIIPTESIYEIRGVK